jgi:mannosyltransferase
MKHRISFYLMAVALMALVAFAVRAASLDAQSMWRDEVDAVRFSTGPWAEILSSFARPGWNGPFYFLLLRGWIALAGPSEYATRFFSLAFGVLGVPLVYALGRRLFDRQVGLLAALLVVASPYLTWYGQEVKMYTLVAALALTAIYGLRRAVEGAGWGWWAVQVVATSLAFYAHILAALLVPVQVLLTFAWWPQARRQWAGALASLVCLTLPYLPLALWQAPLVLQARETGFYAYALDEMIKILLNGWSTGILSWGWPWATVLISTLAVWGLVSPMGRVADWRGRLALLGWLAIPLLAVWLISLRQPLFTDRYLIWTAPAFYLLVALGLASLCRLGGWDRRARTAVAGGPGARRNLVRTLGGTLGWAAAVLLAGTILACDGVNLWRQATAPIKSDFRAATAYVASYRASDGPTTEHRTSDEPTVSHATDDKLAFKCFLPLVVRDRYFDELIVFQIPYGRHTFDYYFPTEEYPWAEGLYTNHRAPDGSDLMGEQEVAYRMQEMTAGHDVVWLVATEVEMWDERGLVRAWLEANAQRTDEAHFVRVDVYRYVMRET